MITSRVGGKRSGYTWRNQSIKTAYYRAYQQSYISEPESTAARAMYFHPVDGRNGIITFTQLGVFTAHFVYFRCKHLLSITRPGDGQPAQSASGVLVSFLSQIRFDGCCSHVPSCVVLCEPSMLHFSNLIFERLCVEHSLDV